MKRQHLIKPVLDQDYPTVLRGKGIYLYDTNGKKYIDASSGAVTASIGHGVPEIINAMNEQANKVSFVYRSQFTSDPAERLAEKLAQLAPGDVNWSFFVNSGSEATETAMKIAIQYWQEKGHHSKNKILSRWMSYHGITIGALSMSGHIGRRQRFVPLLEEWPTVSAPYCYRCPFHQTYPECNIFCAEELERAIKRVGKEHIAAFIAEPVIGAAAAAVVPPEDYYVKIKEICERNQILFIADEVMTGIGRTGKMFAMDHWGVVPDLIALGKGMSAGYTPMAATLVSDRVMEPIMNGSKLIMSGHTYSANPQSAAVSLAVLHYIEKEKLIEKVEEKSTFLFKELCQVAISHPIIGDVRGKGLLVGVEFVSNLVNKVPFKSEINLTNLVINKAMEKGLLLYPAAAGDDGIGGSAVLITPPLVITENEVKELVVLFKKTIEAVELELKQKGLLTLP
ncbi:aspartate aminotransferase family protein [Anaerobacillus sp. MEB173]|uniref:aspartate aminotransferase family protein n=1 Tax=Anaerobacillus sp. MEB173 TaxID=3383345 RepID=UPI003F90AADB